MKHSIGRFRLPEDLTQEVIAAILRQSKNRLHRAAEVKALERYLYSEAVWEYEKSMADSDAAELMRELRRTLTNKQNQALRMLLQGYSEREIGAVLGVSCKSVGSCIGSLRRKLADICEFPGRRAQTEEETCRAQANTAVNRSCMAASRGRGVNPQYNPVSGPCITIKF